MLIDAKTIRELSFIYQTIETWESGLDFLSKCASANLIEIRITTDTNIPLSFPFFLNNLEYDNPFFIALVRSLREELVRRIEDKKKTLDNFKLTKDQGA